MKPFASYPRMLVEFLPYDPRYPAVAQQTIDIIRGAIPEVTGEHIGSTAVPGCAGRGVIDLMILYDQAPVEPILDNLERLGFQWVQRENKLPDEWPKGAGAIELQGQLFRLHIHVQPSSHPDVAEKRAFRDRLVNDLEFRTAYMKHKQTIIASGTTESIAYTAAKASFVQQATGLE